MALRGGAAGIASNLLGGAKVVFLVGKGLSGALPTGIEGNSTGRILDKYLVLEKGDWYG